MATSSPLPVTRSGLPTTLLPRTVALLPPFPISQRCPGPTSTRSTPTTSMSPPDSRTPTPTPDYPFSHLTDIAMTCIDGRARLLFRHTGPNDHHVTTNVELGSVGTARDLNEMHGPATSPSCSTTQRSTRSSTRSRSTSTSEDENITPKKRTDVHPHPHPDSHPDDTPRDVSSDPTYFSPSPKSRIGKKARVARSISESYLADLKVEQETFITPQKPTSRIPSSSTRKILSDLSFLLYHSDRLPEPWLTMLDVVIEKGKVHLQTAEVGEAQAGRRGYEGVAGNRTL